VKSTRFADGTHLQDGARSSGQIKKALLARDHSLGQEVMEDGEEVTVEGFSWQDPFRNGSTLARDTSTSSDIYKNDRLDEKRLASHSFPGPPPPPLPPHAIPVARVDTSICMMDQPPHPPPPHFRWTSNGSIGSIGQFLPPGSPSNGYSPPPPHPHLTSEDRRNFYSYARYESWGPAGPSAPSYQAYLAHPHYSGSWQHVPREHSLVHNPLPNASVSHPASYAAFDSRSGSGYWPPPHGHDPNYNYYYPPDSSAAYQYPPGGPPAFHLSSGPIYSTMGASPSPLTPPPPPSTPASQSSGEAHIIAPPSSPVRSGPPSPPYQVDFNVAQSWSGQDPEEIARTWSGEDYDTFDVSKASPHRLNSVYDDNSGCRANTVPKPDGVKRMTSNQNETPETRTDLVGFSVKRCALNRDHSMVSNRLKAQYKDKGFNSENEITQLSTDLEHSSLGTSIPKPQASKNGERAFTYDPVSIDLTTKQRPMSLSNSDRSSTLEELALDVDHFDSCGATQVHVDPGSDNEGLVLVDKKENPPRPEVLHASDRFTTSDFLGMIDDSKWTTMVDQVEVDEVLPRPDWLRNTDRVTTSDFLDMINEPVGDS
jgi:hypothetical protein